MYLMHEIYGNRHLKWLISAIIMAGEISIKMSTDKHFQLTATATPVKLLFVVSLFTSLKLPSTEMIYCS